MPSQRNKLILLLAVTAAAAALLISRGANARPDLLPGQLARLAGPLALQNSTYLLYAETNPASTESTLWAAPVDDLSAARALANISHRVGYPPVGSVSPDGRWVAIFIIPPGVDERSARLDGGELWLATSDGSQLERLAGGVGQIGPWSPDSGAVSWSRLVELEEPRDEQIPFRTEVYRSALDGAPPSLLLADETAYGVIPLGWTADGGRYLAARIGMDGVWTAHAYATGDAESVEQWPLPITGLVRDIQLSPSGENLLVEEAVDGENRLRVLPLGGDDHVQAQAAIASQPFDDSMTASPVSGMWSTSGERVWVASAPADGAPVSAQVMALGPGGAETVQSQPARAGGVEVLLPESWSPDEQWFAWLAFPRPQSDVYVQRSGEDTLRKVPLSSPENWISVFGWLGGGAQ